MNALLGAHMSYIRLEDTRTAWMSNTGCKQNARWRAKAEAYPDA